MISEVVMPQMGADMKEGTVLRWLKEEGDTVDRGEVIAEIETDKANIEIEAFEGGQFRKVLVGEGETVDVGTVIAVISAPGDDISSYETGEPRMASGESGANVASMTPSAPPSPVPEPQAGTGETAAPAPSFGAPEPSGTTSLETEAAAAPEPREPGPRVDADGGRQRVSPVARRLAEEKGVDLAALRGSGPDGRIVRRDVEEAASQPAAARQAAPPRPAAVAQAQPAPPAPRPAAAPSRTPVTATGGIEMPAPGQVVEVPLSRLRQTTARRMQQSKRDVPHYYLTIDVDMTEAVRMRAQINEGLGDRGKVSINDMLVLAATRALQSHPRFNSWYQDDRLQVHGRVNMGIAIALDDGLVAPAILDTQAKPLTQIAREARELADRARSGQALSPEEYTAGTFTITNLGAFGVDGLIGIINPPQTAILGVGRVAERAVASGGQVVVRSMMTLALSADHRATDGAEGARFLQALRDLLEKPALMFV